MQDFSATPFEMIASCNRNRALILALTKREVIGRYRGSLMGIFWSFLTPVFMLAVYTFVFSFVLKARWNVASDSKAEFALILFSGLLVFNFFSECLLRSPTLIVSNINYVKKVVFPLEILSCVTLGAALFHTAISFLVWLVAYIIVYGTPHITIFYLPLVFLPLIFFTAGVTWALASLGTYLRDISQLVGIVTTTLMFVSPIFYPATALPEQYRKFLYLNPLTPVIEQVRAVLFWGTAPDLAVTGALTLAAAVFAWLGFYWFQKTRKGFADVL